MTEHKFTDEEVIKALGSCGEIDRVACDSCVFNKEEDCIVELAKLALDLINRQKAEIERLTVELVGMRGAANSYKMHYDNAMREVARLTAERDAMHQDVNAAEEYAFLMRKEKDALIKTYKECTAEVIKEFAERLKTYYRSLDKTVGALVEYHIDEIVKEMLEGG